jgi:hypothetical protein
MKRASDHAMLLARRANAERNYARTKDMHDLTEVMRASTAVKSSQSAPVQEQPRIGSPIGQRWS